MIENQRVWAEIDLDIIARNVMQIRKFVPSTAEIMAVVKADGYGHGAYECAKIALYAGAKALGVAILEEGIELRENNIMEPVLILGYTPERKLSDAVKFGLSQTVFHKEMAKSLSEASIKLGIPACIHIKIDTGMGRLGFLPTESAYDEIAEISRLEGIKIEGVYTHLADADALSSDFSHKQFELYSEAVAALEKRGVTGFKKHMLNSAGSIRYAHMAMDMVRTGILMYGLTPSEEIDLSHIGVNPAMSLKSRISYVKKLEPGSSIGYGRTFFTNRQTIVATVPVGYADGYAWSLSNKGRVIVCGRFAPIIGKICMDQFMIDITDIPGAKEETEVIIMGGFNNKFVSADEIAEISNSMNYEVVCGVGKRVPRVYLRNGEYIKIAKG